MIGRVGTASQSRALDDHQHASVGRESIQIEGCMDRFGQRILLNDKQDADLPAEHVGGDRHDVVAADDAIGLETVRRADGELGGQASNGGRDRRHRHTSELGSYELPVRTSTGRALSSCAI